MRRMVTTKELDLVNELNKYIEFTTEGIMFHNGPSILQIGSSFINFDSNDIAFNSHNEDYDYIGTITVNNEGVKIFGDSDGVGTGHVYMPDLPTSDPQVEGALWNDNGTLKISAGE